MAEFELTGLCADLPIGAMAALGVLRVSARVFGGRNPRLGWRPAGSSFHAVLQLDGQLDRQAFISELLRDVAQQIELPALRWKEQLKGSSCEEFAAEAKRAGRSATALERREADWMAAFGTEFGGEKGLLETTEFDMSAARQKFPADAVKLGAFLTVSRRGKKAKSQLEDFEEALYGPWRYTDDQHSFGWDPTTMKLGAFSYQAPTKMPNSGVRAAVWLAFECLPLFPCFYSDGFCVRGFLKERRRVTFYWPVWSGFIGLAGVKSLLGWPGLFDLPESQAEASERGIAAIYRSERFKVNKYVASFRPPELVYSKREMSVG